MSTQLLSRRHLALVALLSFCWGTSSVAKDNLSTSAALNSINIDDIQEHVDYLAADALKGREPNTIGGRQAGDYLAAQLEKLNIRGASVDGGYIQSFGTNYRNILGMIEGSDPDLKNEIVIVCAHYDHVGYGTEENSAGPIGHIHNGADDNASGTSALLELAEAITRMEDAPKRSILLAFWDAEELEMLGSRHWAAHPTVPLQRVVSVINLDMIGRLRDNRLTVYGIRSGFGLRRLLSLQNDTVDLEIDFSWELEDDGDHYTFFMHNIPVLFLHTGLHDEFHTPNDDAHLINSQGIQRITRLLFHLVYRLSAQPETLEFRPAASQETEMHRKKLASHIPNIRDRIGVKVSRSEASKPGLRIKQVAHNSSAARSGLRAGDRIIRFAGKEVPTEDALTSAVLLAEHQISMVVQREYPQKPLDVPIRLDGNPMRIGITWREDDAEPGTVILTRVISGSPAANAKLSKGDRIYQVASQDFANGEAFLELINSHPGSLQLLVERDGRLRTVVIHFSGDLTKDAA